MPDRRTVQRENSTEQSAFANHEIRLRAEDQARRAVSITQRYRVVQRLYQAEVTITGHGTQLADVNNRLLVEESYSQDFLAGFASVDQRINQANTDRANADAALSGRIDQANSDRVAADNALSGRITTAQNTANAAQGTADDASQQATLNETNIRILNTTVQNLIGKFNALQSFVQSKHSDYNPL